MRLPVAAVAYLSGTFWTFAGLLTGVGANHHRALGVGTPLEVGVLLDLKVAQKLTVFIIGGEVDQGAD
jgi:hypothetical protein